MKDESEDLNEFVKFREIGKYSDKPSKYAVSLVNEVLEEEDQNLFMISDS